MPVCIQVTAMALGTPLRPLGRGHCCSSRKDDMPDTEEVGRGGEEGLGREEDSELGFWEPSLISVLFLYVIGALERKFTFNPPLTS